MDRPVRALPQGKGATVRQRHSSEAGRPPQSAPAQDRGASLDAATAPRDRRSRPANEAGRGRSASQGMSHATRSSGGRHERVDTAPSQACRHPARQHSPTTSPRRICMPEHVPQLRPRGNIQCAGGQPYQQIIGRRAPEEIHRFSTGRDERPGRWRGAPATAWLTPKGAARCPASAGSGARQIEGRACARIVTRPTESLARRFREVRKPRPWSIASCEAVRPRPNERLARNLICPAGQELTP